MTNPIDANQPFVGQTDRIWLIKVLLMGWPARKASVAYGGSKG